MTFLRSCAVYFRKCEVFLMVLDSFSSKIAVIFREVCCCFAGVSAFLKSIRTVLLCGNLCTKREVVFS